MRFVSSLISGSFGRTLFKYSIRVSALLKLNGSGEFDGAGVCTGGVLLGVVGLTVCFGLGAIF
jgi:hypothetical protein